MTSRSLFLGCAMLGAATLASAQSVPPRRAHHTMFYDEAAQRILMTGGSTPLDGGSRFEFFNDLWSFDGREWKPLPSSGDRMSGTSIAGDSRGRIYSFGGYMGGAVGSVRILEGDQWKSLSAHPTVVAAEPGFVFDSKRGRFITFGGSARRGQANADAWEFDGTTWKKLAGSPPPTRQAFAMVYDARRDRVVVFGGGGAGGPGAPPPALADTWEYDGATWRRVDAPGPAARVSPGAAFDSKRGLMILFGGSGPSGFLGDTWSFDGSVWKKIADSGPEARAMGYMAYDKRRDRIVLFGGRKGWPDGDLNDTWEWDGSSWTRVGR
jgi:hypothetical protein